MSAPLQRQIASVQQRERIRNEIAAMRQRLGGKIIVPTNPKLKGQEEGMSEHRLGRYNEFMNNDIQEDQALIRRQVRHMETYLSKVSPGELGKRDKNRLEKQANQDREWLRSKMGPKRFSKILSYTHPEFQAAKQASSIEISPAFQKVANRFKNAMRQIDPENAEASNLETIRPE